MLQERQIERNEHQDDTDVGDQPFQRVVPKEQDINTDHDHDYREHVQDHSCFCCHRTILLRHPNFEFE